MRVFILPDDLLNLLINDGDLGDCVRYKFCCAPLDDDVFCMWGQDDVGVEGREFAPEGTFLVDGEVDLVVEGLPIFLILEGVKVDVVFADVFAFASLGEAVLFSVCKLGLTTVVSISFLGVAAS